MSELSYILNGAGERSLIILDEIGRGTSTYDGLSIAWATCEYLCNENTHIRTLFATHYHELTALAESIPGVFNLNVDVAEDKGEIVFLHKIVPGGASRSYGIHVAKLAGVPSAILEGANLKLSQLESMSQSFEIPGSYSEPVIEEQLNLFSFNEGNEVVEKLKKLDLMNVTPSHAIGILEELKELIKK